MNIYRLDGERSRQSFSGGNSNLWWYVSVRIFINVSRNQALVRSDLDLMIKVYDSFTTSNFMLRNLLTQPNDSSAICINRRHRHVSKPIRLPSSSLNRRFSVRRKAKSS